MGMLAQVGRGQGCNLKQMLRTNLRKMIFEQRLEGIHMTISTKGYSRKMNREMTNASVLGWKMNLRYSLPAKRQLA